MRLRARRSGRSSPAPRPADRLKPPVSPAVGGLSCRPGLHSGSAEEGGEGLVDLGRLVVAVALMQELRERLEWCDLVAPERRRLKNLLCLSQEPLRLDILALGGSHEPERKPRGRARGDVPVADRLARLEREALRLVEAALVEQDLRQ